MVNLFILWGRVNLNYCFNNIIINIRHNRIKTENNALINAVGFFPVFRILLIFRGFINSRILNLEQAIKNQDESDWKMEFSRADSISDFELLAEGEGWAACWISGAGGLVVEKEILDEMQEVKWRLWLE